MIYGSVCSGIEAASVAWHQLGWRAAFLSEVEAFPRAVLAHHYPDTPLHGDFTTIEAGQYAAIDVLVGGTPCQSFSIAGLRGGLGDDRGNLALEYLRLAHRLRPRWLVWENVPGVLSSSGGRDFGAILGGMVELGYGFAYRVLDAQYVRVDGFGRAVPQRRRRVFVVGYLGDWRRAAAVLFERESLCWHSPPRREAGQGVAPTISARPTGGGGLGTDFDRDGGLVARCVTARQTRLDWETETFGAHALRADGFDGSEDVTGRGTPLVPVVSGALGGCMDRGGTVQDAFSGHLQTVAFDETQITSKANYSNPQPGDPCHPLASGARPPTIAFSAKDCGSDAMVDLSPTLRAGVMPAVAFRDGDRHASTQEARAGALLRWVRDGLGEEAFAEWGLGILDTLQPPQVLRSALHGSELRPAAFSWRWVVHCALSRAEARAEGAMQSLREARREGRSPQGREPSEQLARELGAYLSELPQPGAQAERFLRDLWDASEGLWVLRQALSAVQKVWRPARSESQSAFAGWRVRRLTPEECEFLMGYPRGYTAIPYRGKSAADGPRYKALGNSMAVNVMRWIGRRIEMVNRIA